MTDQFEKTACFITLEGGEGAGKSTCLSLIEETLVAWGEQPLVTREPGGTEYGEALRALWLDPAHKGLSPMAELLSVFAARAEHIDKRIRPALARGQWVLSDRFTEASYAYQGAGRQLGEACVSTLETMVQGDLQPDLTILLDVSVDEGLRRATKRASLDRIEQEERAFFERVRDSYLKRAAAFPERIRIVDANQPLDNVLQDLKLLLNQWRAHR